MSKNLLKIDKNENILNSKCRKSSITDSYRKKLNFKHILSIKITQNS